MENLKPDSNQINDQGLLDALESLSAALSVVSISVDMVREELKSVLSVLAENSCAMDAQSTATQQPELFNDAGEPDTKIEARVATQNIESDDFKGSIPAARVLWAA